MKASGRVFLSRMKPVVTKNGRGEFMLTLFVVDRIATHQTEAWRLEWIGPEAQAFHQAHAEHLVPGQPLQVELDHIRNYTFGTGGHEFKGTVTAITLEQQKAAA